MSTYPDTEGFAFSFSHAKIILNDKQYTAISNVTINQPLNESAVYGAANKPLRRTPGVLQMGTGKVKFSDFEEGNTFFSDLGVKPLLKLWVMDYSLVNEQGLTRSVLCTGCRLTAMNVEHEQGPDALPIEYPFSFLIAKINGQELI